MKHESAIEFQHCNLFLAGAILFVPHEKNLSIIAILMYTSVATQLQDIIQTLPP